MDDTSVNSRDLTQHGNHVDKIEDDWDEDFEWMAQCVDSSWDPADSNNNEALYAVQANQEWLRTLSSLRLDGLSALVADPDGRLCRIPLFEDDSGDGYQINLDFSSSLPEIICPAVYDPKKRSAAPVFEVKCRKHHRQTPGTPAIPTLALRLGPLDVNTAARTPKFFEHGRRITEHTDYDVVVDLGSEDMPLWILASRRRLRQRASGVGYIAPIPPLPIFESLMGDVYWARDTACILSSIRRLGTRPPSKDEPSYREACELVRKTRAEIDPAALVLPVGRLDEIALEYVEKKKKEAGVLGRIASLVGALTLYLLPRANLQPPSSNP